METEQKKISRAGWGSGPWDSEPDRVEFKTEKGFPGLITRTSMGHLCGYVAVPPGHPAHGLTDDWDESGFLKAHGGITYGSACRGHICHVPAPGEPDDVWWLGFDAAHSGDLVPSNNRHSMLGASSGYDVYRDVPYMRAECERLAVQLAEMATPKQEASNG